MALFLSTYINKIDSKGRVSVPSPFRAALSQNESATFQGLVLFKSNQYDALEGFSMARMEEMSKRLDHFDMFSAEQDDMATAIFAESVALGIDGDGRIVLPQDLMQFAQLSDQAAFVGLGTKFQIWAPALLQKRKDEARASVQSKKLTLPAPRHRLENGEG